MRSVYLLPVLLVLVVGVSQAYAYDGKIDVNVMDSDITIGDIVQYKGRLVNVEPSPNAVIEIRLLGIDGSLIDTMTAPVDSQVTIIGEDDKTWNFEFKIDTSRYDLLTDVMYTVQAIYEDKMEETELTVFPTLEQSIVDAGNAQVKRDQELQIITSIPEWVRNIFVFYANNEISDQELINAIQYLIDVKILKI